MSAARATRSISILGEPRILADAVEVPVAARRERTVLALLALAEGMPVSASTLVESIWGDSPPATARKVVQVLVGRIRAALDDPAAISTTSDGYALAPVGWTFTHVIAEGALDRARRLADERDWNGVIEELDGVVGMWHGPSLGSFASEPWAIDVARRLDAARDEARFLLASGWLETGAQERATVSFMELVARDPEALGPRIALARSLGAGGRVAEALGWCRAALSDARDRGAQDAVETLRALERTLLAGGGADASGPQLPRVPIARHPMLGRDVEHASVRRALDTARIATIVGPGGTGKTRLAMAVASELQHARDVAWIDWSAARSSGEAIGVLLVSLGISSIPGDPIDALVQAIDDRRLLLVLDNAEQVIDVRGDVEQLVRRCANLSVLATSRIAFGIEGEHVESLAPLDLVDDPDDTRSADLDELPAVRLFRDRSALVGGIPVSDPATLRDVHRICALVDGLPLGIELAAARSGLLPPRDMVQQLERTLDLLATRSDEHPARHRSLDRVIAWSYDLLDVEARWMFAVLSMFEGGGELEDIAHVARRSPDETEAALTSLVASSLASVTLSDSRRRWSMLPTIGAFGRSPDIGLADDDRSRWAHRFLDITRRSNSYRPEHDEAVAHVLRNRVNVTAAFGLALQSDVELAADIFISLDRYLSTRGSIFEGDRIGRQLEPSMASLDPVRRTKSWALAGRMAHYRGDDVRSEELLDRAEQQVANADDATKIDLLLWRAERVRMSGRPETAMEIADRARADAREAADPWREALALAQMGFTVADRDQTAEARPLYQAALEMFEDLGDRFWAENMVANIRIGEVLADASEASLAELVECVRRLRDDEYWAYAAHVESYVLRGELELGRFDDAVAHLDGLVGTVRRTGEEYLLLFVLACGAVALLEVDASDAAEEFASEVVRVSVRTGALFIVDYGLAVLAIVRSRTRPDDALVIAQHVDRTQLVDSPYRLDHHILAKLEAAVGRHEPRAIDDDREGALAALIRDGVV